MNENEFEYDGKKYIANEDGYCLDCAFYNRKPHCSEVTPSCLASERKDGVPVNFIEVKYE